MRPSYHQCVLWRAALTRTLTLDDWRALWDIATGIDPGISLVARIKLFGKLVDLGGPRGLGKEDV